jgi:hypothetical protein
MLSLLLADWSFTQRDAKAELVGYASAWISAPGEWKHKWLCSSHPAVWCKTGGRILAIVSIPLPRRDVCVWLTPKFLNLIRSNSEIPIPQIQEDEMVPLCWSSSLLSFWPDWLQKIIHATPLRGNGFVTIMNDPIPFVCTVVWTPHYFTPFVPLMASFYHWNLTLNHVKGCSTSQMLCSRRFHLYYWPALVGGNKQRSPNTRVHFSGS